MNTSELEARQVARLIVCTDVLAKLVALCPERDLITSGLQQVRSPFVSADEARKAEETFGLVMSEDARQRAEQFLREEVDRFCHLVDHQGPQHR